MTIANPSSIYTEVLVDEADIANIRVGQKAEIVATANMTKTLLTENQRLTHLLHALLPQYSTPNIFVS